MKKPALTVSLKSNYNSWTVDLRENFLTKMASYIYRLKLTSTKYDSLYF